MGYQTFISYRRETSEAAAYLLFEKLTAAGYKAFYDMESLSNGKFNTRLLEVIDSCENFIIVLSPHTLDRCVNEDDWIRKEVGYAISKGKNIIPVFTRGFDWPDTLPDDIKDLRHYNGVHMTFEYFDSVIQRIIKCMTEEGIFNKVDHDNNLDHMLFWGDYDNAILEKTVKKLELGETQYVEILNEPLEILSKNLAAISCIILVVTDVTKFSSNLHAVERLNEVLVQYVRKGGKLICAHDVIYRRTKNFALQEMYGCKITNFKAMDSVKYIKTDDCKDDGHFESLPDEFELHDAEVCWGDLAPDVDVHFETEDGIPLVFSREYGKGVCIYLNPGDYKETPPRSISKPEKEFVKLLRDAILFEV